MEAEFPIDEVDEVREPGDVAMLPLVLVLVAKVGWVVFGQEARVIMMDSGFWNKRLG